MLCRNSHSRDSQTAARGLTLVEMLISMAITLLMMAAVVTLFANVGAGVRNRRAGMELGSELRVARARLFKDLAGATCAVRPKLESDDHDDGYLEIVEGQWSDRNPSLLTNGIDSPPNDPELEYATSLVPSSNVADENTDARGLGDYDDILALTVRSESEPFIGQWSNPTTKREETVESDLAEVIWYAVENPADGSLGEPGMRTIYRRVLLIAPWLEGRLQNPSAIPKTLPEDLVDFYRSNDISVRREDKGGSGTIWVPNTLSDLTKREYRFAHLMDSTGGLGFPFAINQSAIRVLSVRPPPAANFGPLRPQGEEFDAGGNEERQGEDVMLNDVLAFDLRVYDPGAPLYHYPPGPGGVIVEPSADPVFNAAVTSGELSGYGAFVDLGWDNSYVYPSNPNSPTRAFRDKRLLGWHPRTPNNLRGNPCVYDTWPYHYESDGINQADKIPNPNSPPPVLTLIDEGTNRLDDDNANGIDDALEREAPPPYDIALRGIQVKLRVYDRDSRQIREATVTRSFVPQ